MHSGDLSEMERASLSEQEKEALLQVMERAKEFDRQINSAGALSMEGQLYKWTNPLKGWQPRWFSVDRQQGVLHYYTSEDKKKQAPRGSLHLWGAVVAPSEEDSQSFSVNGANGEIYKLRGQDAKERQYWVSRLRREVEFCTNHNFLNRESADSSSTDSHPVSSPRQSKGFNKRASTNRAKHHPHHSPSSNTHSANTSAMEKQPGYGMPEETVASHAGLEHFPGGDAMLEVLTRLQSLQDSFRLQLQTNATQAGLSPTDKKVLLSRATSHAAVTSIKDCLALLKVQIKESQSSSEESPHHNISITDQRGASVQECASPSAGDNRATNRAEEKQEAG